ncbi:hypothetical protein ACWLKX_27905, partial [Klebsiella pneumoniae]
MKQLTVFEMEAISGGYSWDFSSIQSSITSLVSNGVEAVVSAATMGTLAAVFGTFVGGTRGLTLSGTKTHVKQRFLPLTPLLMVSD